MGDDIFQWYDESPTTTPMEKEFVMIKVVSKKTLIDGTKEKVLALYEEMIAKTRKESGCISYELFELDGDPNTITFIEEWESPEKLEAHKNSEHFKRIVPAVAKFAAETFPLEIYKLLR
jgi:quinol monooxygenase YgiN